MADKTPLREEDWALWENWLLAQRALCRELERALLKETDISEAEFSLLAVLQRSSSGSCRVTELADALNWDKNRVAHQLARLEQRGFINRHSSGASGRRLGVELSAVGRDAVELAFEKHGYNVRRMFLSTMDQTERRVIATWSRHILDRLDAPGGTHDEVK